MNTAPPVIEVSSGLCGCGCGLPAPIAKQTDPRYGHVKGEPVRFILGHHTRLRYGPWLERYWSKIDKNGPVVRPELGPCWLWIGYRDEKGYGEISVNGRIRPAHQVALELVGFVRPFEGLVVLHQCDNSSCVRPDHLRIDTVDKNNEDMVAKGRLARGERQGSAKLNDGIVAEIRSLYAAGGVTQEVLSQRFDVSQATISLIIRGKFWKHVA